MKEIKEEAESAGGSSIPSPASIKSWSRQETLALIEVRREMDDEFHSIEGGTRLAKWDRLLRRLCENLQAEGEGYPAIIGRSSELNVS